jgi:hypothetical protein
METEAAPVGRPRLSVAGQTYVAMVAVLAAISTVSHDPAWYVVLVALSLPLSLLALWVGLYAGLAVGFALGHDASNFPWEVALVWVVVWTATAWLNAQVAEKIVRRGWSALSVSSPRPDADDLDD